jgi:glycosyltransferase involved in cell wall biosynthesis
MLTPDGDGAVSPTAETDAAPAPAGETLELTILMPCLNEAETLETCVRKAASFLARAGLSGEVIVADNGSTDGSREIAAKAGARVIPVPVRGYGAALMGGIEAARGRYVIMGDADDSYDLEHLDAFVEKLRAGADLVMGNRFQGGIAPGAMPPLHKYLGNPVLSFLGRLFFPIRVGDFHCGLRGFSREAVRKLGLRAPGMEFASEMVVKAALYDLKIDEVPTTLRPDGRSRAPHLKTWRDGWRHLRFLLLHSPRWLFLYPGMILMAAGVFGVALLAPGAVRLSPNLELDVHTLIAACFSVILGAQLVMFSAVARRYAASEGFLPPLKNLSGALAGLSLERVLQVALILFLCGAGGAIWAVIYWAGAGFGAINYPLVLRVLMIALTAIVVAVQAAASAFLASVFEIRAS